MQDAVLARAARAQVPGHIPGRFALTELLGYPDVRNYDGSWTEYGSLVRVPVELGG